MTCEPLSRRSLLAGTAGFAGTALLSRPLGLIAPAAAVTGLAPTLTMRGGANNYRPNAPMVDRLGSGFFVRGKVLRAGDGAPLKGLRIQIWAATVLGGEPNPVNHGSVQTRADVQLTAAILGHLNGASVGRISQREPTLEDAYVALVTEE